MHDGFLSRRPEPTPHIARPGARESSDSLPSPHSNGRRTALGKDQLARQARAIVSGSPTQRTKIWEFATNLHCSIIGTCLSTAELRQVLLKAGLAKAASATEHDLHASGVLVAGKHREGAKLLQKALDRRHRVAVSRFDRAKSTDDVRALWSAAVQAGEIPGAYWAALTHHATTNTMVNEIFAEVHMLSHLVGAANRADIRRLRQLEGEKATLEDKISRQQSQLRDAILARDDRIRELRGALETQLAEAHATGGQATPPCDGTADPSVWTELAGDLKRRLERTELRAERAEASLDAVRGALRDERTARLAAEQHATGLRDELDAIEASLDSAVDSVAETPPDVAEPLGRTLLYVGGRPSQIEHLRAFAERAGATLLHHDGGQQERGGLLPGLVSRADAVLFPVDCVSHEAMLAVKRLCRHSGKPYLPLRSAGVASFCAALRRPGLGGGPLVEEGVRVAEE